MAEDLQSLMERIQKEAVAKAEQEASKILSDAKAKAAEIVKNADAEAASKLEKADKDAEVYTDRSTRALEQAARDVLISVGNRLTKMINEILLLQVEKNLSESTVKEILLILAKNYSCDTEVVFSEKDKEKLLSFVLDEFKKSLNAGVKVESDSNINYGFRLNLENGTLSHEFTDKAIAEALAALLRPQLAKIVSDVAQGK